MASVRTTVVVAVAPSWRGGFGRLWSAAVVSRLGDALRGSALPLLAASLTDSPLLVSLVTVFTFLPWLLFGLLGGALADRVDQRRAMWAVDAARGALMAAFAVAVWLGQATIGLLIALSFALTTLQTLFDSAATALLPRVVAEDGLVRANARLMTGQEVVARFVGAPLVPVLLGAGLAIPYAADAASYLLAAALVASLPVKPRPRGADAAAARSLRREVAEGIRVLWRDRRLRALCLSTTLCNVGIGALIATLVLLVKGWLHTGATGYAVVITAYGIGGVTGGALAGRLTDRLGRLRTLLVTGVVQLGSLIALGTIRSLPAAALALGVFGLSGMVWNVTEVTMVQQGSPPEMLGRINSAVRTISVAGTPLGALAGGAVATAWGLNTPVLLTAGLFALGIMALLPVLTSDGA